MRVAASKFKAGMPVLYGPYRPALKGGKLRLFAEVLVHRGSGKLAVDVVFDIGRKRIFQSVVKSFRSGETVIFEKELQVSSNMYDTEFRIYFDKEGKDPVSFTIREARLTVVYP
jgi:hypothetical protein